MTKKGICPECGLPMIKVDGGYNKYGCPHCHHVVKSQCAICKKAVAHDEKNTCTECDRTFCEDHNTIGSHWNGDSAKDEHLASMCDTCGVAEISGRADNS